MRLTMFGHSAAPFDDAAIRRCARPGIDHPSGIRHRSSEVARMRLALCCFFHQHRCARKQSAEPPTLGSVADGRHARKIIGIAGAARQVNIAGAEMPAGTVLDPTLGTVLGRDGERLVLSPQGDAAVLWRERTLKVLTGLGDEQNTVRELNAPAKVEAVALSNGGKHVALTTPEGIRITGLSEYGIQDVRSASALAFAGSDLLLADVEAAVVWRIGAARDVIATDITDVRAIATEGARLVIARANGTIVVRDMVDGSRQSVACRCTPRRLERLAAPGLWLLTNDTAHPLWVLDLSESHARTSFVSAIAVVTGTAQ
jgi:hypothetical protein